MGTSVTRFFCPTREWLFFIAAFCLYSADSLADDHSVAAGPGNNGFTLTSDAPNITQWGLGAGVAYEESPYKGDGSQFSPIPVVYFEDKWIRFLGTTLDIKAGQWDGFQLSLRGRYALGEGYKGSDAPILNDMQTRDGAVWLGPAMAWDTEYGRLSGDFLTAGNKGLKAHLEFGKSFGFGQFSVEPHIGAEWLNSDNVDYYYGVRQSEARPGRSQYNGKSTYNVSAGARVDYQLSPRQRISLDMGVTRLGSGITDSPLVGRTYTPQARLGYLYQFR